MNPTHSKRSIPIMDKIVMLGEGSKIPMNLNLKKPCACDSGKKFKHCCYNSITFEWGWIIVGSRAGDFTIVSAEAISEIPFVCMFPTYVAATRFVNDQRMESSLGEKVLIIRVHYLDVITHLEMQATPGNKVGVYLPPEITADSEWRFYEVNTGSQFTPSNKTPISLVVPDHLRDDLITVTVE